MLARNEGHALQQLGPMLGKPRHELHAAFGAEEDVYQNGGGIAFIQAGFRLRNGSREQHTVPSLGEIPRNHATNRLVVVQIQQSTHASRGAW